MKKIYVAIAFILFLCCVLDFAISRKSQKQKIQSALSSHFAAPVSVVSFRPVSVAAPDSIALAKAKRNFDFYSQSCAELARAGGDFKTHWLGDSLVVAERAFYAAAAKMPAKPIKIYPYTLCAYTAGPDTLHAILDEHLRVIWPR